MLQISNQQQQHANNFGAMELENHSKNEASPKSLTSRIINKLNVCQRTDAKFNFCMNKKFILMMFIGVCLLASSCATIQAMLQPRPYAQVSVSPGVTLSRQIPIIVLKNTDKYMIESNQISSEKHRIALENALQANGLKVVSPDLIGSEDYPTVDVLIEKLKYSTVYLLEWTVEASYYNTDLNSLTVKMTDKRTGIAILSGKTEKARAKHYDFHCKLLAAEMSKYFTTN
ncbi:MAG: hypothetical protein LBT27_08915 [Prevotellaceae bacterium]|jgi:hypothetical protein|nr:hypothetical protein [Prevotellaceae bacterium]